MLKQASFTMRTSVFTWYTILVFSFLTTLQLFSQERGVIEGTVTGENGPLKGVNITVLGTPHGTVTDGDGYYRLELPGGTYPIRFQFLGYRVRTDTLALREGSKIVHHVRLEVESIPFQGVVVQAEPDSGVALYTRYTLDNLSVRNLPALGEPDLFSTLSEGNV